MRFTRRNAKMGKKGRKGNKVTSKGGVRKWGETKCGKKGGRGGRGKRKKRGVSGRIGRETPGKRKMEKKKGNGRGRLEKEGLGKVSR